MPATARSELVHDPPGVALVSVSWLPVATLAEAGETADTVGVGITVTDVVAVVLPQLLPAVTVYVPPVAVLAMMPAVVAPVAE